LLSLLPPGTLSALALVPVYAGFVLIAAFVIGAVFFGILQFLFFHPQQLLGKRRRLNGLLSRRQSHEARGGLGAGFVPARSQA
jgi:hypothetical protein